MSRRKGRNHSAEFKVKVALAALLKDKTLAELAQQFDIHVNQITEWKRQLLARSGDVLGSFCSAPAAPPHDLTALHAKIRRLTLDGDFLEGALTKAGLLNAKRRLIARTRYQ